MSSHELPSLVSINTLHKTVQERYLNEPITVEYRLRKGGWVVGDINFKVQDLETGTVSLLIISMQICLSKLERKIRIELKRESQTLAGSST